MFRLEAFIDDKKLSYVLWALAGHCVEIKPPQPVMNASAKNGAVRADATGDKAALFVAYLRKKKVATFVAKDCSRWCTEVGLSPKSYSNVLYKAIDQGLITRRTKKGKQGYIYSVTKRGA